MERDFLIEAYYAQEPDENESLSHHGIIGQHWGVRRYQNKDGSLTPEGRQHWGVGDAIRGAKTNVQKYVKSKKAAALRKKKSEILARGDVDEILENKKLFTTNELDKAIGRSQRISMLKAMTPEQQKAREKAIKDQEKAARGKEAVDRGLYRAGQLVQMAPAMIQCYAIVRGLLGHGGGSVPTPTPTSSPSPTSLPTSNQNGSHSATSIESALASVTYNKKYKLKAEDVESLTTTAPSITVDMSSLPSWSNPTTNAVFTDCVHTAANVPMSSLTSSTTFSANTPGFNILSDQSFLNDAIIEYN